VVVVVVVGARCNQDACAAEAGNHNQREQHERIVWCGGNGAPTTADGASSMGVKWVAWEADDGRPQSQNNHFN
jgi:hypothetical protein